MRPITTKLLFDQLTEQFQQPFAVSWPIKGGQERKSAELVCASAAPVSVDLCCNAGFFDAICICTLAKHGCPDGEWFFIGPFSTEEKVSSPIVFDCGGAIFVGDPEVSAEPSLVTQPLIPAEKPCRFDEERTSCALVS